MLLILFIFASFSGLAAANKNISSIHCSHERGDIEIIENGMLWEVSFNNCTDGDRSYRVTYIQSKNKSGGLDNLLNETNTFIRCLGKDIVGEYKGVSGKVLFGKLRLGAYYSISGKNSLCGLASKRDGVSIGVEYFMQKMKIDIL